MKSFNLVIENRNINNFAKFTPQYLDLKLQELDIAFEYNLKKQEEKEHEREERKIQKQLDAE